MAFIEHFDIEARGPASATKDQMRLMMQSLLTSRFRIAVHRQAQQIPVYDLVEEKPGRLGPNLQPHGGDPPCAATSSSSAREASASAQPMPCGTMSGHLFSGRMHVEGRGLTLDQLADYLQQMQMPALDRPVLDGSQVSGLYDFTLEWTPEGPISLNGGKAQLDETGPSFIEALKEQLGLRLVAQTGTVDVLVIDHIEEPSAN
ncbi:MAG: TIGR03435 family protein [Candidatus Acidiferrales bacterium]